MKRDPLSPFLAGLLALSLGLASPALALHPTIEGKVEAGLEEALRSSTPIGLEEPSWDQDPEAKLILSLYPDPHLRPDVLIGLSEPKETVRIHVERVLQIAQLLAEGEQGLPDKEERLLKIGTALHDAGRMRSSGTDDALRIIGIAQKKIVDRNGRRIPVRARDMADHYGLNWRRSSEMVRMIQTDLGPGVSWAQITDLVRDDIAALQTLRDLVRRRELSLESTADQEVVEAVVRASVWAGLLNDRSYVETLEPGVANRAFRLSELLEAADVLEASTNFAHLQFYGDRPRDVTNIIRSLDQKVREGAISKERMRGVLQLLNRNDPRHGRYMEIASKSRQIGKAGQAWSARDQALIDRISEGIDLGLLIALVTESRTTVDSTLTEGKLRQALIDNLAGDERLLIPSKIQFVIVQVLTEMIEDINKYGVFLDREFPCTARLVREPESVAVTLQDQTARYHREKSHSLHPYDPFLYKERIESPPDYQELIRRSEAGERGGWGIPILHGYFAEKKFFVTTETVTEGVGVLYTLTFPLPSKTGLEEVHLGTPTPVAGSDTIQTIPVSVTVEDRQSAGRAVVLDPTHLQIRQVVNPSVTSGQWDWQSIRGLPPEQHPGITLAQLVADPSQWGPLNLAAQAQLVFGTHSLQTNFWEPQGFLVANGQLAAIPGVTWSTPPWVFVLDAGNPGLRQLPLSAGIPQTNGIREAIAGPVLVREGRDVSDQIHSYPPEAPDPNQVRWDPATTAAAFSAIGRTANNRLIALSLAGEPERGIRQATVRDMAQAMLALGAVEAVLLGGSMDVQQWVAGESQPGILGRHNSPPHGSGRRLNAALFAYLAPEKAGLEEPAIVRLFQDQEIRTQLDQRGWSEAQTTAGRAILLVPGRVETLPNRLVLQTGLEEPPGLLEGITLIKNAPLSVAGMLDFLKGVLQELSGESKNLTIFFNAAAFSQSEALASLPLTDPPPAAVSILPEEIRALSAQELVAIIVIAHKTGPLYIVRITKVQWQGETALLIQA